MAHRLGNNRLGEHCTACANRTVEPVFGIIKRVMGWRQMSMRGLAKAQGEWSLVTMAWNIKRMHAARGHEGMQGHKCAPIVRQPGDRRGCALAVPSATAENSSITARPVKHHETDLMGSLEAPEESDTRL